MELGVAKAFFQFGDARFELGDDCEMACFECGHLGQMSLLLRVEQPHHESANGIQAALFKGCLDGRSKRLLVVSHTLPTKGGLGLFNLS